MSSSLSAAPGLAVADAPKKRSAAIVQIVVAVVLSLAMASYFWIDSRYPALLKKLHAGNKVKVSAVISFDAVLPVTADMPLRVRILRTTGNWLWANRIGMSFGICFGAALLTLLPLFSRRRFKSALGNTLLGVAAGAPLGVCANCVAPIGRGLVVSGASPNTALAAMISSPTLNVVVLAMAFTLFPLPVALLKVITVIGLLALVPFVVPKSVVEVSCEVAVQNQPWTRSLGTTVVSYLRNLGKVIVATVPLMLLAALLGAVCAELLPASTLPAHATLFGIVLVALVGTFLPVPMAFDVALAFVLMTRGVPLPYVVTLLCTLGVFSVFSFFILGRTLSWKTAATVFGSVVLMGTVAGIATGIWQHSF